MREIAQSQVEQVIDELKSSPFHLTAAQCRYLHLGPSADGDITPQGDLTVEMQDGQGWIFVHQTEAFRSDDPEGSGVWVDTDGHEHYGP